MPLEQPITHRLSQPAQGVADRGLCQVQARCSTRDAPLDIHPVEHHEKVEVESIQMNGLHKAPREQTSLDRNVERFPTSVNLFIRSVIVRPRRDCPRPSRTPSFPPRRGGCPGARVRASGRVGAPQPPPLRGRDEAVPLGINTCLGAKNGAGCSDIAINHLLHY